MRRRGTAIRTLVLLVLFGVVAWLIVNPGVVVRAADAIRATWTAHQPPPPPEDDVQAPTTQARAVEERLPADDPESPERDNAAEAPEPERVLHIVLDDAGHSVHHYEAFAPFPDVLTIAVLPGLPYTREVARMAMDRGDEVILHQPMEAFGGHDPGPGAILVVHDELTVQATLLANLAAVPGLAGLNNHMGSRATSDRRVMETVVRELARQNLFLLDSRTASSSVAVDVALEGGIPVAQRDVFLDNDRDPEAIARQLAAGERIARERGYAVLIGHVTVPELAAVLIAEYDRLRNEGFTFAPVSAATRSVQIARSGY